MPRELAAGVSPLHAVLEREGSALRVRDRETPEGCYASPGRVRLASFEVRAGQSFWVAGTRVLVMDTQLEVLRPALASCLGLTRHDAVDAALESVASGRPVALVGPRGTGARPLAEAIHHASPQRDRDLIVAAGSLPALADVRGAGVFVDLDRVRTVPEPWLRAALDPMRSLRVIFTSVHDAHVHRVLDHYRERISTLRLVPLARRPDDVLPLLAHFWRDDWRSRRLPDELGLGIANLETYPWPGNLDELQHHARRLLVYLEYGGLRPAAAMLGIRHQTLAEHFRRIGFSAHLWLPDARTARDSGAAAPQHAVSLGLAHRSAAAVWHSLVGGAGTWLAGLQPVST